METNPAAIADLFNVAFEKTLFPGSVQAPSPFAIGEARKVPLTKEQLMQISKHMGVVMSYKRAIEAYLFSMGNTQDPDHY